MKLPEFLEKQYEEALEEYKREKKIPFITAAERIGLRRGIAEGFQQGYTIGRQEGLEAGQVCAGRLADDSRSGLAMQRGMSSTRWTPLRMWRC
jgi:flagellar biosynthesis/type III secretory pathway protein FliH